MKFRVLLFLLLCVITNGLWANEATLDWQTTAYGKFALVYMKQAPFPHESRKNGFTVNSTVYSFEEHYNNSTVAIIIPKGYVPRNDANVIIYIHGNMACLDRVLSVHQLGEQLDASKKQAILIIPQGPYKAPDSMDGKLDDPDGAKKLIEEALSLLQSESSVSLNKKPLKLKKVIIMGHSGAYYTLGSIVNKGGVNVSEAYLLDATYGQLSCFATWAPKSKHRLISIFTQHLAWRNTELMALLSKTRTPFKVCVDKEADPSIFKNNRILFIPTTLTHVQVPYESKLVERALKTSKLPNIR